MKRTACFALLAVLAAGAGAQVADKNVRQAQEQRHGDPQAQEEQAGKAALQNTRKPDEPARAVPRTAEEELAQDREQLLKDKKNKRPPRHEVAARIGRMPASAGPEAYGPVPRGKPAPLPGTLPGGAPSTATIVRCVGGMCTDTAGRQYQISGNVGTDSKGRQCTRTATTVQCF